ncbi:hypothetical protein ACTFIY_006827 [Dictyostelium cf. discoideum]
MANNNIMGIDFGTHFACVGIFKNERIEICPNQQGNRTTPSVVSFVGDDKLVGDEAKAQMDRNPLNTIYDVKRLLGRKTTDELFEHEVKKLSFKVTTFEDNNEKIEFQVNYKSNVVTLTPIEIATSILEQIKHTAETFIGGESIKKAVISVPTDFTEKQRNDLKEAATAAGITVVRMIHEHSAVALAYGYDQVKECSETTNQSKESNVMVFDLGGSGVSASMIRVRSKLFEMIGNVSDHTVSGEHFDHVLVQHFTQEFNRKYRCDLTENARSKAKLKSACEKAKRNLSNMTQAALEIDSLYDGRDFFTNITRARFEDMASGLIKGSINAVSQLLEKCNMTKEQVDKVLLVGGASRIPSVQNQLLNFFDNRQDILERSMNQEEVVAYGTTIQATILAADKSNQSLTCNSSNISMGSPFSAKFTPATIGIQDSNGNLIPIIPSSSLIPCKRTFTLNTSSENQDNLNMAVYQGSAPLAKDNQLVSRFIFKSSPNPIDVTFEIDNNNTLLIKSEQANYSIKF